MVDEDFDYETTVSLLLYGPEFAASDTVIFNELKLVIRVCG